MRLLVADGSARINRIKIIKKLSPSERSETGAMAGDGFFCKLQFIEMGRDTGTVLCPTESGRGNGFTFRWDAEPSPVPEELFICPLILNIYLLSNTYFN